MTTYEIEFYTEIALWIFGAVGGIALLGLLGCLVCDKLDEHYPLN